VFVSPGWINHWNNGSPNGMGTADWELSQMKAAGIRRVILQNAAGVVDGRNGAPDVVTTAYPAPAAQPSSPGFGGASFGGSTVERSTAYDASLRSASSSTDEVGVLLNAGDATSTQVSIGLINSSGFWDLPSSMTHTDCVISPSCPPTPWLSRQVAYAEQVALEVWTRARSHPSFAGWYLPMEFSSSGWTSPAARSDLLYLYGSISGFLSQLSPGQPITVAPFVTLLASSSSLPAVPGCPWSGALVAGTTVTDAYDTPCGLMGQLVELLSKTKITEVLLQDGLGDPATAPWIPMTADVLGMWTSAVQMAVSAASALRGETLVAGSVSDLYTRSNSVPGGTTLVSNLSIPGHSSTDLAGFSWGSLDPAFQGGQAALAAYEVALRSS
jgi:hypothetical protein